MAATNRSSKVHPAAGRISLAVVLAVLLISAAAPAQAAPAQRREPGTVSYTLTAYPSGPITMCIGETRQIAVKVEQATTRVYSGKPITGPPRPAPGHRITPSMAPAGIGTLTPATGQAARLQWLDGSLSADTGAWFTFTATKKGSTTITFKGAYGPVIIPDKGDPLVRMAPSTATVVVNVGCKYKVSVYSSWDIPNVDVQHFGNVNVQDVILEPGDDGSFSTSKAATGSVARTGMCGGSASMSTGTVGLSGKVDSRGMVAVDVTYPSGGYTGSEGCMGKSMSGSQQPQPLHFIIPTSSGARHYFRQLSHILVADRTFTGPALVYFDVLVP